MLEWNDLKRKLLKDPKFKKEYERLEPRYTAISALIELRTTQGYSRRALAKKLRTKWSAFTKIENADANPSIGFLQKLAEALGKKLVIRFE